MAPRAVPSHRACVAVFLLFAACCGLPAARSQSVPDCGLAPLGPPRNRTVNIAVMFWGPLPVNGMLQEVWLRNPILDGWNGPTAMDLRVLRSHLLWEERMELPAEHGGGPGLILLDGSVMRFNLTWFNAGDLDDDLDHVDEYAPTTAGSWPDTLIKRLANATGPYGRQHFIITPLPSHAAVTMLTSIACEASQSCITVAAAAPNNRMFICQDPMPIDCITRKRRTGSRRFEYTVSPAINQDYWGSGSLAFAVNQGIKRVFIVAEPWAAAVISQHHATAALLGLEVVGVQMVELFGDDWAALNTSAAEVTERMRSLDVHFAIFISGFNTPMLQQLLQFWKQTDYLPAAVLYQAGGVTFLPQDLRSYFFVETMWLPQLTGPQFHAVCSENNFETFPANDTHDSPAVFTDAYRKRFHAKVPLSAVYQAARSFHAVTIVQKLLELSQTEDTESVRYAAARIAAPGVYRAVQFDQWGRSLSFDNYVLQLMPDGETRVLTPLGLGSTPVIPIPGWSEREYHSAFLSKTSDRVAFGLTIVTVLYTLGWLVWLVSQRHDPLIRVADPLFHALSLCGIIVLASACFFAVSVQTDVTCAAFEWMFILGLTLSFAPLVLKNLRIWSLWHNSASFNPAPIRQWHTVCALCVGLLIDVALLAAWEHSTGLRAHRISPDLYRPALDYYSCDYYQHARGYVFALMSCKFLMLSCAMYLAFLLRNVSAKYSESRFIALCVYNVMVVLAIFVPVSATNAAGTRTYLVRILLVLFLCVSTASIMFGQSRMHRAETCGCWCAVNRLIAAASVCLMWILATVPKFLAIRRGSLPQRKTISWSETETRTEDEQGAENRSLQLQQQSHAPQNHQRPVSEPENAHRPAVRDALFSASSPAAVIVHGIGERCVNRRSSESPPAPLSAFQSVLGLSQIAQRCTDEQESEIEQPQHSPAESGNLSAQRASASLLRSTFDLLIDLPAAELDEVHSSLLRRRYRPPQLPPLTDVTLHVPSPSRPFPLMLPQSNWPLSADSLPTPAVVSIAVLTSDGPLLHSCTRSAASGAQLGSDFAAALEAHAEAETSDIGSRLFAEAVTAAAAADSPNGADA